MPTIDTTDPVNQEPLSADISTTPQLPASVADQRAFKAKFGINSLGMTIDQISQSIKEGQEDAVRQQAVVNLEAVKQNRAYDIISELAKRKGAPLSPAETGYVFTQLRGLNQPTDPKSVFEEYYSQEYANLLDRAAKSNPDSEISKAMQVQPEITKASQMLGTTFLAKNEFTRTIAQNLEAEVGQQSMVGWVVDQGKMLIPGYTDIKLRGNVPNVDSFNFDLLGGNLTAQMKTAYRLPFPQYKEWLLSTSNRLKKDNPELALRFVQAMLGQSYTEENLNSLTTAIDATFIKPLSIVGLGKTLVKGLSERDMSKAVSNAVTDQIKATKDPALDRAGMHEAVGDIPEAAVTKTADNIIAEMKGTGDPTRRGLEGIASYFNRTVDAVKSNNGPASRELINRIEQRYNEVRDAFLESVQNTMRVDRLPAVFAVEKNIRAIKDEIRTRFPGLDNTILDISTPTRDAATNSYFVGVHLGQTDGTLFGSERAAQKFISDTGLKGEVVKSEGRVKTPGNIQLLEKQSGELLFKMSEIVKKAPNTYDKSLYYLELKAKREAIDAQLATLKATPVQQGVGWKVVVYKPLKETDSVIRDALLATSNTKTPASWLNAWGGWLGSFRTPEETLAMEQLMNRKVATYAPSNFLKVLRQSAKEINDIKAGWFSMPDKRQRWQEWQRVISAAEKDRAATGELFQHPSQLSDLYQRVLNRMPDEQEIAAAFAYKRNSDLLDVFRNLGALRNKSRLGAETHTISIPNPYTSKYQGYLGRTQITVDGVRLHSFENLGSDTLIRIGKDINNVAVRLTDNIKNNQRKLYEKKVSEGSMVLLRITNPDELPFKDLPNVGSNVRPRYVLVDKTDTKPLQWNQVFNHPRPADYDYEHYISQAHILRDQVSKRNWYEKDNIIGAHNIGSVSRDIAKKLDDVRKFIKSGNYDEAEAANPLSTNFSEVRSWFEVGPNGQRPLLSLDEPIVSVPRNQMVGDVEGEALIVRNGGRDSFRDGTTEGYGRYIEGKRDVHQLFTAENYGTKANPLYNATPAEAIDPITSLNRGLNKVLNETFMDDYKIFSVEHWIQEAKAAGAFDVDPARLADAPYYYFFNGKFRKGVDPVVANNLETARFQIKQFLGVKDQTTTFLHHTAQVLADSLYDRGYKKLALAPAYLLPTLRDPFAFIRSFTFDAKLGLFNPGTFLTNLNTYATILGVAGFKYAAPGTRAAFTHWMTRMNQSEEVLTQLDKLMSKKIIPGTSEWRPGEWREAFNLLQQTGFGNIAGEYALRDNPAGYNILTRGVRDNILNPAAIFFTESERLVRYGAFYTAFREFRDKVPARALTEADKRTILQRADTLSVNMSRASNSKLQEGVFSLPSQFLTYQLRTAELFLGKRLSAYEKGRLFTTYAALYGIPGAFGLTGYPFADHINKWVAENTSYTPGQNFVGSAFWEGGIAAFLALGSGGNWYNVQEKYGVQGLEPIRELLRGDKTTIDLIGGASFSTLKNMLSRTLDPGWKMVQGMFGDEDRKYQPTMDNFLDIFREISSVNAAWKLYHALNTGKIYSRNENLLTENVSTNNAIFRYLSGLSSKGEATANLQNWSIEGAKDYQSHALQQFIKEYRRAIRAEADNQDGTVYYRNAKAWLLSSDYPREKWADAYSIASKGYETYIDRMNEKFLLKDVLESQREPKLQQFENIQRMKQGQ